jgi:hypothetical protein
LSWQRLHSDCGGGAGVVIAAMLLVGTIIAAAALVGAAIAVMAALVQQLRQPSLVGAVVEEAVALAQGLWRRRRWRSDCSDSGVRAGIMAASASAQRLRWWRWRSDCGVGGVRAAVAATGLVGHSGNCGGDGVGAGIASTAVLACGNGSLGAVIFSLRLFEIFSFPSSNHERVIDLNMISRDIFIINPRGFIFCLLFEILIFLQVSIAIITSQNNYLTNKNSHVVLLDTFSHQISKKIFKRCLKVVHIFLDIFLKVSMYEAHMKREC